MPPRAPQQRKHSARAVWLRGTGSTQQVRLVQRPADASLMAGMWELPLYEPREGETPECTLRHAITVTNHVVDIYVMRRSLMKVADGEWVPVKALAQRALTGLTRKALRQVGCME
jgi:A/G-specific adenine glycosylase